MAKKVQIIKSGHTCFSLDSESILMSLIFIITVVGTVFYVVHYVYSLLSNKRILKKRRWMEGLRDNFLKIGLVPWSKKECEYSFSRMSTWCRPCVIKITLCTAGSHPPVLDRPPELLSSTPSFKQSLMFHLCTFMHYLSSGGLEPIPSGQVTSSSQL